MIRDMLSISKKAPRLKDRKRYLISSKVIRDTERVLQDYACKSPSNEGLVYWAGKISDNVVNVTAVIAPNTESDAYLVSTSHKDNFHVVNELNELKLVEVAQVHSHPGYEVDHSYGDDRWAAFKFEGLLSLVVPNYCKEGILPLEKCGIHRYKKRGFTRLSIKYVKEHFQLIDRTDSKFVDLRR